MAYFYVKSGGTATGDAGRNASAQTGTFAALGAANYYDNISDAFGATTVPAAGDFILVSDSHSHSYSASVTYSGITDVSNPVRVISVSDTAIDSYSSGATENIASGAAADDMILSGSLYFKGLTLSTRDRFDTTATNTAFITFENCTLTIVENTGTFRIDAAQTYVELINCTLNLDGSTAFIRLSGGNYFRMIGGTVQRASGTVADLFSSGFNTGGGTAHLIGVNLSDVDSLISTGIGGITNSDVIDVRFERCRLSASVTYNEAAFENKAHKLIVTNCESDSDDAIFQYYKAVSGGTVTSQDETGIHRDETTTFDSGAKISLKVDTDSSCSEFYPLVFELSRFMNLSVASTDTVRIYLASTTSLTDNDIWAELVYPDGVDKQTFTFLSNKNSDILAAGTALTTDSGSTWKNGASDLVGYNEYYMDLDTSGDPGSDSVPQIRVYCGVASATIYFDPAPGEVA